MAKREKTATVDLGLRVKEGLRARLQKAAESGGNSINGEIVQRLERSFERQGLLKEVLTLAYGRLGPMFAEAHASGIFTFRDGQQKEEFKRRALQWMSEAIDKIPSKEDRQ